LYEKFARLLAENNKTVYQVSKDTGVPQTTLSNWKQRGGSISVANLKKLADYFGVPMEFFLDEGDK